MTYSHVKSNLIRLKRMAVVVVLTTGNETVTCLRDVAQLMMNLYRIRPFGRLLK